MVQVKIEFEHDEWFPENSAEQIKELKTFARKVKALFNKSKAPGKQYIKKIYVTLILETAGVAHLSTNSFSLGMYQKLRFGDVAKIKDKMLRQTIDHEIGHIYLHNHPELQKEYEHEQFAKLWQRRKWR